jgi:hypothetical protein
MNMFNDQVRESSNSIHNYLLISFMAILKASTLGHKYIYKKGLNNYYISENNDKTQLHAHDCTISDGKDQLKIEMKTKQSNGLNLQYLKENALLRTSHLFFKKSRWLLVVAVYSKELRQSYNEGDMLGFLNDVQFIMAYGNDYEHKWTELKSLNQWGKIIRGAASIESLFNLISKENTRPRLTLTPYIPTPKPTPKPTPTPTPTLPLYEPTLKPRKNKTTEEIDKALHQAIALHKQYGFTTYVLASLVGLSRNTLQGRIRQIKSNDRQLTSFYCTFLHSLLNIESLTIRGLNDSINKTYQVKTKLSPYLTKTMLDGALSDGYILLTDGNDFLQSVNNTDDHQPLMIEVQEKLKLLSSCDLFNDKVLLP